MSTSTSTKALIGILLAGTRRRDHLPVRPPVRRSEQADLDRQREGARRAPRASDCLPDVSTSTPTASRTRRRIARRQGRRRELLGDLVQAVPQGDPGPLAASTTSTRSQGVVFLGILSSDNPDNQTLLNFQSDYDMTYPVDPRELRHPGLVPVPGEPADDVRVRSWRQGGVQARRCGQRARALGAARAAGRAEVAVTRFPRRAGRAQPRSPRAPRARRAGRSGSASGPACSRAGGCSARRSRAAP